MYLFVASIKSADEAVESVKINKYCKYCDNNKRITCKMCVVSTDKSKSIKT